MIEERKTADGTLDAAPEETTKTGAAGKGDKAAVKAKRKPPGRRAKRARTVQSSTAKKSPAKTRSRRVSDDDVLEMDGVTLLDVNSQEEDVFESELVGDDEVVDPFDPRAIDITHKTLTIDLLLKRIRSGELDLNPDFQRNTGVWKVRERSRLIESVILGLPLPTFYFDATDEDHWLVVDGIQRLSTLADFSNGLFRLRGLEFLTHLNGSKAEHLPRHMYRRFEETQIHAYMINPGTPEQVRYNLFKRINTGGTPLNQPEILNALYQGSATRLLKELAGSDLFRDATLHKINNKRFRDRDTVLRGIAFCWPDAVNEYRGSLDIHLREAMERLNRLNDEEYEEIRHGFYTACRAVIALDPSVLFARREQSRLFLNRCLFELWISNLMAYDESVVEHLKQRKAKVHHRFRFLVKDEEFQSSISVNTGGREAVETRHRLFGEFLDDVMN